MDVALRKTVKTKRENKRILIQNTANIKKNDYLCSENLETYIMATAIKAIPTLYGDEARRFGEAALQAELNYDPRKRQRLSERRLNARRLLKEAGLIASI